MTWSGRDTIGVGQPGADREIRYRVIDASAGGASGSLVRTLITGVDNDDDNIGLSPSVAYNPDDDEYVIAYAAETGDITEIVVQKILGPSGLPEGSPQTIGNMGQPSGFSLNLPKIVYNQTQKEYLVAWKNPIIIAVQRIAADTLDELGADDFQVLSGGTSDFGLAYSPRSNEYFLTSPTFEGEQVLGQRLSGVTAGQVGENDFVVSAAGFDLILRASVVAHPLREVFLVAWSGERPGFDGMTDGEKEVFGQLVSSADGTLLGPDSFRISDAGDSGDGDYSAFDPAVTFDPGSLCFLAAWVADDTVDFLVDNEFEVFGQLISPDGREVGPNDFRISDMGPEFDGDTDTGTLFVSAVAGSNQTLVMWMGNDVPMTDRGVYAQRLGGPNVFSDSFEQP